MVGIGLAQKSENDYLKSLCEERNITRDELEFDIKETVNEEEMLRMYEVKVIYQGEVIGKYSVEIFGGYDAYFYVI